MKDLNDWLFVGIDLDSFSIDPLIDLLFQFISSRAWWYWIFEANTVIDIW